MKSLLAISLAQSVVSNYIESEAKRFMDFAGIAYCCDGLQPEYVDNWNCDTCAKYPGVQATRFHSVTTDTNGYVSFDPSSNSIVVAFSGTDPLSVRNWIDDIDIIKVAYPSCSGCEVHMGFFDAYKSVQDDVKSLVSSYMSNHPGAPVSITGHSLGAALTVHCAADLFTSMNLPVLPIYTFGQPRVGNQAFEEWFTMSVSKAYWRVVHDRDPVVHEPEHSWGFYHNVQEVFYDNPQTSYKLCSATNPEDPACSYQFEDHIVLDTDLVDHLNYLGFNVVNNYLGCYFT